MSMTGLLRSCKGKSMDILAYIVLVLLMYGCSAPMRGPDKQGIGVSEGSIMGATTGALYGAQVLSVTGQGALVGAGIGAAAGAIQGMAFDSSEEARLRLSKDIAKELKRAKAQQILGKQYERRLEMHPTREIYPADIFFEGDGVDLTPVAKAIIEELARLHKDRMAWSRLEVRSYVKARDKESSYSKFLGLERAKAIANYLVNRGIEPRRISAKAVLIEDPILLDPFDNLYRYNQAVELIFLDR